MSKKLPKQQEECNHGACLWRKSFDYFATRPDSECQAF